MFNETAEKWFNKVEENKVYIFANGQVKLANKKFTSIKNDYCLTFGNETEIQECAEDKEISSNGFSFTKLEQLANVFVNATVDVIGVVVDAGQITQLSLKSGERKDRQSITIADDTGYSISITVWGDMCQRLKAEQGQLIAFKACRVSEYAGKSLNASSTPQDIVVNAKHARCEQLRKWFNSTTMEKILQKTTPLTEGGQGGGGGGEKSDQFLSLLEMQSIAENNIEIK